MSDSDKPDGQLVAAALDGCVASFGRLYERYYAAMVAVAYAVLADDHLAEDAAQEAFARASHDLPRLKEESKFAPWLAAICRNVAKQTARTRKRTICTDYLPEPAGRAEDDGSDEAVRQAIGRLSSRARELIILRYYNGMSYDQISTVLGLSRQAINGRLIRAKRKIEKHLKRNGFAGGEQ